MDKGGFKLIDSYFPRCKKHSASLRGQSIVEYALIVNGIVLVVMIIIFTFGDELRSLYQSIVSHL